MRNIVKALTVVLTLALLHIATFPGDARAEDVSSPPDLKGVWKGTAEVYYPEGVNKQAIEFTISEQDGWYFKGVRHWKLLETSGRAASHIKEKAATEAEEPVLGVINFDGKSFNLVEVGDYGMLKGSLVGNNQIELIYMESGDHPLVSRTRLTKE